MTLALPRPLSESISRSLWIGQRPPLGSLQLSGVCRAAGYVFLVSSSSPPYLEEARRPLRPLSSPSSPSAPVVPPAPSLKQPPPPSALAWGEGAFLLGARRLLQASILFFVVVVFPSFLPFILKIALPLPHPWHLVKGNALPGGVLRRGFRGAGWAGGGGPRGGCGGDWERFFPPPIMCVSRVQREPPA